MCILKLFFKKLVNEFEDYTGSQWLRICAFTAEDVGSIPGWGTKIPNAT